ncbi:MAG: hypothetical protein LBO74_05580 [Candidatus Symbiothrix sp.]|jgi:hypothetical protein|nr:hypothetical protein [Candidatus Symbiothrix sp.]
MMKTYSNALKGIFILAFLFSSLAMKAAGDTDFAGGAGTSASPWEIATATQFNAIRDNNGASGAVKYFKLTADIDLGAYITDVEGWLPIGSTKGSSTNTSYYVVIDGNNHLITGLWINKTGRAGLFNQVSSGTLIKNLGVILDNSKGGIQGTDYAAGIATYCSNTTTLQNVYVIGDIKSTGIAGGLIGFQRGPISNSYVVGTVTGSTKVGGLVGTQSTSGSSSIINSYANVTVTGSAVATTGALVGEWVTSVITSSYFNTDLNPTLTAVGNTTEKGGVGKTAAELANKATYADWDFTTIWKIAENGIDLPVFQWQVVADNTPDGSKENPFLIHNEAELIAVRTNMSKYYKLANDITLTGAWTPPPASPSPAFTGGLDGDGYKIIGLTFAATTTDKGLFSDITGATIKNLGIELAAAGISNTGPYTGALGGYVSGATVENVYVTGGSVTGTGFVGALIGGMTTNCKLINCYALNTDVSGISTVVGGLVGFIGGSAAGNITNCHVVGGTVQGAGEVGGLAGRVRNTTIENSYATVSVSPNGPTITDHFGGLVGYLGNSTFVCAIKNSYATGDVTVAGGVAGGLVGSLFNSSTIENSYATGNVDAGSGGGLVGTIDDAVTNAAGITNCYATGTVKGVSNSGGLVGVQGSAVSTITNSFAFGKVTDTDGSSLGAFVGNQSGTITGGGYNTDVKGDLNDIGFVGADAVTTGLTALPAADFKKATTYSAWDLASSAAWSIYDKYGFPYIKTISNYILIAPDAIAPVTYTGSAITPPALTWTADANYNATAHTISGDLALESTELINAGDYKIVAGTVDLKNPYYQVSFKDDVVFTINKAAQTITFEPAATLILGEGSYSLVAVSTSGLPVAFSLPAEDETFAEIEYADGTASLKLKAAGTITVTASVAADDNYEDATPVVAVIKIITPQTITFAPAETISEEDLPYTLVATSTSNLPVLFKLRDTDTAAAITDGQLTVPTALTADVTVEVTAYVAPDEAFVDATPVVREITITQKTGIYTLQANDLKTTVTNGLLKVSGLTAGQSLSVYSIQGATIYRQTAVTSEQGIQLPAHGVYLVVSDEKKIKVVY